jgi:hypothetical protein
VCGGGGGGGGGGGSGVFGVGVRRALSCDTPIMLNSRIKKHNTEKHAITWN